MTMRNIKLASAYIAICLSIFLMGCGDDAFPETRINVTEDFFCNEDSKGIFIEFEVDGTPVQMDLCDFSATVRTNSFSGSRRFDTLYSRAITITGMLGDDRMDVTFHGFYYLEELDVNDDRAYADAVFGNEQIVYALEEGYGSEEYIPDGDILLPPSERPSYVAFEYFNGVNFFASTEVDFAPGDEVPFQQGSTIDIVAVEAIDYQNPEFSSITYNYIVEATFTCQLYDEIRGVINITNGRFRLPFDAATTAALYQSPFG